MATSLNPGISAKVAKMRAEMQEKSSTSISKETPMATDTPVSEAEKPLHLDETPIVIPTGMTMQQVMQEFQAYLLSKNGAAAQPSAPAEPQVRKPKTYFHTVPGSSIVFSRRHPVTGDNIPEVVRFSNVDGHFTTSDELYQDQLDILVELPYAPVWLREDQAHQPGDAQQALDKVLDSAVLSSQRLGAEAASMLKGPAAV